MGGPLSFLNFMGISIALLISVVLTILPLIIGWRIMIAVERIANTLEGNFKLQ